MRWAAAAPSGRGRGADEGIGARVEENLELLEASLSAATYGDLIAAARGPAGRPCANCWKPTPRPRTGPLDALAEGDVAQANALVLALESSGLATRSA